MKTTHAASLVISVAFFATASAFAGALDVGRVETSTGVGNQVFTVAGKVAKRDAKGLFVSVSNPVKAGTGPRSYVYLVGAESLQKFAGDDIRARALPDGTHTYRIVATQEERTIQRFKFTP